MPIRYIRWRQPHWKQHLRRGALCWLSPVMLVVASSCAKSQPVVTAGRAVQSRAVQRMQKPARGLLPSCPPGKNLRALVVYFKLADDVFELGSFTRAHWPHQQNEPNWMGRFLIHDPYDAPSAAKALNRQPESLTAYFYRMSGGKLWLYGDEIVYAGPSIRRIREKNNRAAEQAWRRMNTQILQWVADHSDLRPFDNDGDGAVDLIMLVCRARRKFAYQGIAMLPINRIEKTRAGVRILPESGIYQTDCYSLRGTRQIISHEIGHKFGLRHENGLLRWNLMSGAGPMRPQASGVTMSAFEKHKLGWLDYETVRTSRRNVVLKNLTEGNRALQISVGAAGSYFVIENRQYSEPFEPEPDADLGRNATLPGAGLLVYLVHNDRPYLLPADGRITETLLAATPRALAYYNGDASDLYGNRTAAEDLFLHDPRAVRKKLPAPNIALRNIRRDGNAMRFDVAFGVQPAPAVARPAAQALRVRVEPNPFTWHTNIFYSLSQRSHVELRLYDSAGNLLIELLNRIQQAGDYAVDFDGLKIKPGDYLYELQAGAERRSGSLQRRRRD